MNKEFYYLSHRQNLKLNSEKLNVHCFTLYQPLVHYAFLYQVMFEEFAFG